MDNSETSASTLRKKVGELGELVGKQENASLLNKITEMQIAVKSHSESLTKHDLQILDDQLNSLAEKVRVKPRKFAFKSKIQSTQPKAQPQALSIEESAEQTRKMGQIVSPAQGPANGLENCIIYEPTVLKTLHLSNLTNCIVILKEITGPLYLDSLKSCVVLTQCHQLRIHDTTSSDFYVGCARPIIEACHDIKFGQLHGSTEINGVDDFDWVRKEQSTNWSMTTELAPLQTTPQALETALGLLKSTDARNIIHMMQ